MYVIEKNKANNDHLIVVTCGLLIFLGLLARDVFSLHINKYLFLIVAIAPILCLRIEYVTVFSFYIIPLYVGLPGNYISIVFLARMLFEVIKKNIVLSTVGFILSCIISAYIFIQNCLTGYISTYNIMAALDFITLYIVISAVIQYNLSQKAVFSFLVSNIVLGIVMLCSTLRYYSISDLMDSATRLGNSGVLIEKTGTNMITSIDPNFYAMNVIASISSGCLLLSSNISNRKRIIIHILIIGCIILCLIGLSRTFIILLSIWCILYFISQRNVKGALSIVFIGCIVLFTIYSITPTIIDGLLARFNDDSLIGGNGRIYLIVEYYSQWGDSILTFLLGIGLFNCFVHCTPLLYLFGMGFLGFVPLCMWYMHNLNVCKKVAHSVTLKQYIPIIVTFVSFSTIPAAGSINYTMPMLVSMLAISIKYNDPDET